MLLGDGNRALHIGSWKREEYFNSFFSNSCGYSYLILHQNLTSGSFLKSKGILHTVTLKSIDSPCTLNESFTHARFCNIVCCSFGKLRFTELYRCAKC